MTLKKAIKYLLPYGIIVHKSQIMDRLASLPLISPRKCPICGKRMLRFKPGKTAPEVKCPSCDSYHRHRSLWLYLKRKTKFFNLPDTTEILHVAPESCLQKKLKVMFKNYLTADLFRQSVMVKMDITNILYPDDSFEIIFCNHVLEHIPDDKKAMSELYRVLRKDGMAILLVPLSQKDTTYEDWSIITPEGRSKAFGQHDHVRIYGQDYLQRLKSVGFIVNTFRNDDYLSKNDVKRYIGGTNTVIVHCTK